eukprot:c811_g1_i1.p1 GENE.c811_g1_i1~~c811_g1_i1.p1  ORF type:complete len:533 (-),score=134.78 c811_g1_i1:69-1667(-)
MDEKQILVEEEQESPPNPSLSPLTFFSSLIAVPRLNMQFFPSVKSGGEERLSIGPELAGKPPKATETSALANSIRKKRFWTVTPAMVEVLKVVHQTVAASVGNIMEWYDLAIFAYFAPEIGENFFPGDNHTLKMIQIFAVLAGSFFMRPVGAIVMGHIGDTKGRKAALILSIILLGMPTFLVGCLPNYGSLGVMAPVLLIIIRLAQGVSIGGEMAGAYLCAVENAPPDRKAFLSAVCEVSGGLGMMIGSATSGFVRSILSDEAMESWGWRIPFLLAFVVALFGWNVRRYLPEEPEFAEKNDMSQVSMTANGSFENVVQVVRVHWYGILLLAGVVSFDASMFCTTFVWLANYATDLSSEPIGEEAFAANTMVFIPLIISSLTFGKLSDLIGYHKVMLSTALSLVFFGPFAFAAVETNTLVGFAIGQMILALIVGAYTGPLGARMVDFFPPAVRYTAIGIGFNLAQCVLGGTMPVIATLLSETSLGLTGVSLFLSMVAMVTVLCLEGMRKIEKRRALIATPQPSGYGGYGEMNE